MTPVMAYFSGNDGVLIGFYLLILLPSIFWVVEILDIVRRRFDDPQMKIVWLIVVCALHFVGAVAYFFMGKRQGTLPPRA